VLHRDQIGGLALPADLPAGSWRVLDDGQIALVFAKRDVADQSMG
jgi:16S rRNA pseudouridine516 synthase